MRLQEFTNSLSKERQFELAIRLVRLTLPIWDQFAQNSKLWYRDTVVGLEYSVNRNLLKKTVDSIQKYTSTNKINKIFIKRINLLPLNRQFGDPVVALQDLDWELPYEVERTFSSVHNLLDASLGKEMTAFNENIIYVTINQAIDALDKSKTLTDLQIQSILSEYEIGK